MANWISRGLVKHKEGRDFPTSLDCQHQFCLCLQLQSSPRALTLPGASCLSPSHPTWSFWNYQSYQRGKASSDQLLAAGQGLQV